MVTRTTIWAHPTNFYVGRIKPITYIVIHDGETGEGSTPAEGMGNWFAQDHGAGGRSSAHQGADTDSICTYVRDKDTAFGAPGVNANGWHLELAGCAGQTASEWDDADSRLILANGGLAAAEASQRLGIPARWLSDDQLRAGNVKGFITHAQASRVLGGSHWDPGPNFPAAKFMSLVQSHLTASAETPALQEAGLAADDVDKVNNYTFDILFDGFTKDGKSYPGVYKVLVENQRRITALSKLIQPADLTAAVKAALPANAGQVDVDALARKIVLELGKES